MVLTPELTGTTFPYVGKMPGVPDMAGSCEFIEAIPNRRLVWRMTGRMGEAPEWVVDRLGVQWMHQLKAKMEGRG